MTRIVGDSCTDFTPEEKKDEGFMEVPLTISLGDYCVRDDDNFSPQDFTQRLNATTESLRGITRQCAKVCKIV